ncbi:MAG TPA: hypothetical protein VH325_07935 [Bryobacteraceae bacterium]|jgi:hypothetical protein|nr:hypothetical protein [Bryobacteraceae bacterium]
MYRQSIILILAVCALAGQSDLTFAVGGTPVRIGEDQEAVLSRLRQTYQVRNSGGETYLVAEKKGAPLKKIGIVTFENGHLASAGATWGEIFSSDGVRFVRQLVAAIGNQEIAGARTVILSPVQNSSEGAATTGFELLIGDRTIDVVASQVTEGGKASGQYATVMETLHAEPYVAAIKRSASVR